MKTVLIIGIIIISTFSVNAQIGIGTTTPNSTLDIRGSVSMNYRAFSASTAAAITDNMLVFTGTSAATVTLPDATTCIGREYWIKNTSSNTSLLTVATTSSQTIDALSTWLLDESNESVRVTSNGSNWNVSAQSLPTGSGINWSLGGNSVPSLKNLGTINNYDLPFITNNAEKMRLSTSGNLGIGTATFNGTYPEKLVVDAGTTSSVNAIVGKGNINNYLQLNIQNNSSGGSASSDVVATADNGSETTNFVDMGINSSSNSSGIMGAANDAYLYNIGQNFLLGTGSSSKALVFMTGGTSLSSNERMRIDGVGNVGIGISNPSYKLQVFSATNPLYLAGVQTGANTDSLLTIINGVVKKISPSAVSAWSLVGNAGTNPTTNFLGTTDAQALVIKVNNTQVGRFDQNSLALGIGATANNSTQSYAIGSNAAIGYNHTNTYAIGNNASSSTDNSFAIGNSAAVNGTNSFAIGNSASANNTNSLAIGPAAITAYSITDAIAIGDNATANSSNSIAIGSNSTIGNKTQTNAASSIAIGMTAVANSTNAIALGTSASTAYSVTNPISIGVSSSSSGNNAVALGNGSTVGFVANSTALGAATSVTGANSTAVGYNTSVTQSNALILGDRANTSLAVGIGTESFSGSNREKLLVDVGASGSVNAIVGRGNLNNYLQLNIQNQNSGGTASSDVVATADNGTETTNFVDMGINSSTNSSGVMGGPNDSYLYNIGQNFLLGTGTAAKALVFMTGGTTQSANERMRITGTGSVGIATNAPAATLDVSGTYKLGTAGTVLNNMIKTNVVVTDATTFSYNATEQVTITVAGAALNGNVIVNPRTALPTGVGIGWSRVSAANTVVIGFTNTDAVARAIGTVAFDVTIIQ